MPPSVTAPHPAGPVASVPQQSRSVNTRRKLLDATIECIAELGCTGATMDRVVARAGVSRGAQGHHFPTKSLLFQAAMTHMLDGLVEDLRLQTERIRAQRSDPASVFQHLWDEYFSGRLFAVTIELIVASRTDQELREALTPVTERFHRQVDDCFYILNRGGDHSDRQLDSVVRLTMSLLRGMGVQTVLFDKPAYYHEMLQDWFRIVSKVLAEPSQNP
jgi:AcrR family transcriptional regulator